MKPVNLVVVLASALPPGLTLDLPTRTFGLTICVSCSGALVLRCESAAVITSFAKLE